MKQLDTPTGRIFTPAAVSDSVHLDFQTPPEVAEYMVNMVPLIEPCTVLEPTPGQGNIVNELEKRGAYVSAPENFFALSTDVLRYDAVVMNPPFSSKFAFGIPKGLDQSGMRMGYFMLKECMKMSDTVIALMPWFTISDSDVRLRELKKFGLISITALPRKTFKYARIQTCILELCKGWDGPTEFKVFDFPSTTNQ